ncbi:MAG: hypothetical protein LBH40_05860 [Alphaproteobacteria bacterium]|nr:hypothetical protein [Alphaproteobacteria bacterium]
MKKRGSNKNYLFKLKKSPPYFIFLFITPLKYVNVASVNKPKAVQVGRIGDFVVFGSRYNCISTTDLVSKIDTKPSSYAINLYIIANIEWL